MVILCGPLVATQVAVEQPFEVLVEPGDQTALVGLGPRGRIGQQPDGIEYICERTSLDDADSATVVDAANRLTIVQIRIHTRFRIEKPHPNEQGSAIGVFLVAREVVSEREGFDGAGHLA